MLYILSVSFQIAGALLLMLNVLSAKREKVIRRFAGKGLLYRDNNTNTISYDQNALKDVFREAYLSKFSLAYIIMGYLFGVFSTIASEYKNIIAMAIVAATALLILLSYLVVYLILKFSKRVNQEISNEELISLGIEPDIENISNEEISRICR